MDLVVKEGDIKSFAELISRATDDVQAATKYLRGNSKIDDAYGDLWQQVFGPHGIHLTRAENALNNFERILDKTNLELIATVNFYRSNDRATAVRLDATYPSYSDSIGYGPGCYESECKDFRDIAEPTDNLVPPGGSDGYIRSHVDELKFAPGHKVFGTLMDLGSPSAIAAEVIKAVFGYDIFGSVTKWLTGDWDSYANCADVWDNLGRFCTDVGSNVSAGYGALYSGGWSGNAADAAWLYFDGLAKDLDVSATAFESLRDNYKVTAVSVFSFAEIAKGALADICDMAIAFAITASVTAGAASTGVGLFASLVGGAVALERAHSMIQRYGKLVAQFDGLMIALNAIWGVGAAGSAKMDYKLEDFPKLSTGGYDHPSVNKG